MAIVNNDRYKYGVGLDVGTCFLVRSRALLNDQVEYITQRDAFLVIEPVSEVNKKAIQRGLDASGAFYLFKDEKFYIIGQHAVNMASERSLEVDRPLKQGVLSLREKDSLGMLSKIIEILLGPPQVHKEKCVFCVPSEPIDAKFDAIYHKKILASIIESLGYTAIPILEAEALAYSELLDTGLTGITISFGAGMSNICVSYLGSPIVDFSLARGGDWIDRCVSEKVDIPTPVIQSEKESGFDLDNPQSDLQKWLAIYYTDLLEYVAKKLAKQFFLEKNMPRFKTPVKVVVSGGTSLVGNFLSKFETILRAQKLPIEIGEVVQPNDPLTSVSAGCLIAASEG